MKAKNLKEQERKLELTVKKWLKLRREKEAMEGANKDQTKARKGEKESDTSKVN